MHCRPSPLQPNLLGRTIRKLRMPKGSEGISLREAARRARMDPGQLCNLEKGRGPFPSADAIIRLANVLGVPPKNLLSIIDKESPGVADIVVRIRSSLRASDASTLSEQERAELRRTENFSSQTL